MRHFRHQTRKELNKIYYKGGAAPKDSQCPYFPLDKLKPGESAIIRRVGGDGALRRRLLDLGLTPNTKIMVRKVAPFGDPIELFLRNYELTLRRDDARQIHVEEEKE